MEKVMGGSNNDTAQYDTTKALDVVVRSRRGQYNNTILEHSSDKGTGGIENSEDYFAQRKEVLEREASLGFDYACQQKASEDELQANEILQTLRHNDDICVYKQEHARKGYGGQTHRRFCGDHFLSNVELIEETEIFKVAQKIPKGAHLHIHFNANLPPNVLLDIVKTQPRMFITSTHPLTAKNEFINYSECQIEFRIRSTADELPSNLFPADYKSGNTMRFNQFLEEFPNNYHRSSVDDWLESKLIFTWELFDKRTKMMKEYTKRCLQKFVRDNIQYAEIRVNFIQANQIWLDDGSGQINNEGIMYIIINEYEFRKTNAYFNGLKIIYCTPRSFPGDQVGAALDECASFKRNQKYSKYVAGVDLVDEEAAGKPLKHDERLSIPFLFHSGKTIDDTEGNLLDALLMNSRRIGQAFALQLHPYIMQQIKQKGICLKTCPISNEILGLTSRMSGHSIYLLLANNVYCTVSSDNPALFKSTLSHDFYQVLAGNSDITLHGWRQLIEWSLEHLCTSKDKSVGIYSQWENHWNEFLQWIIETYGGVKRMAE
ncbi:hypothetical protein B0H63DRAFT_492050 [Podospora didyma]|uniref:Adenosine deaminase domain-containing protein n=1 Tax=Podospora didyma TaxID=330526 RepID=A0AAE0P7X3_9PEZI|nr:hypothetical protein B0H63DRAFT_492050 [Podospora didyma]